MSGSNPIFVAIVDDSVPFRKTLGVFLSRMGFTVSCEAGNGAEFFKTLSSLDVLPDVCILDTNMPVMDGFATARKLGMEYPEMGIIGHSFFDERSRAAMLDLGVFECVSKDVHPRVLVETIKLLTSTKSTY